MKEYRSYSYERIRSYGLANMENIKKERKKRKLGTKIKFMKKKYYLRGRTQHLFFRVFIR